MLGYRFKNTQYDDSGKKRGTRQIGDLLSRFSKVAEDGEEARLIICMALLEAGIRMDKRDVRINNKMAFIKVSPAQKSQLFLKHSQIIAQLKKNTLTANITRVGY